MNIDYSNYYWKNDFILIRPPRPDDWEALVHNMFDSTSRFYFEDIIEMPTDADAYRQRINEWSASEHDYICFTIENSEGQHVGIANLFGVNERAGVFGPIGTQINPRFRRQGYALAALRMLSTYMFAERRMHKWNSAYIEGNAESATLHQKLGFTIEGVQRDMAFHDRRYWNLVQCGITEAEFFANEATLNSCY